ncbi:hypothetical protein IP70_15685 [alpha proteobacterium AAP38]|nr:hypothetical protein IP70_15685 [alpha proteobacterium AAP38]
MFTPALGRDDAALMRPAYAKAEYDLTAGAGTDNVEQTCATLNLLTGFGTVRFQSGTLALGATATLAEGATLTVTAIWEHSANNSTWVEIGTDQTILTLTGPTSGGTVTGAAVIGINLAEAETYVRAKFKGDLSASGTDTAKIETVYLLTSPSVI